MIAVGRKRTAMPIEDEGWSNLLDFMALMRSAQEAERTGVARRLHDEVGQTLAAFRMRCYGLETRHPQIADELQGLLPSLDDAISVVRELSDNLYPGVLRLGVEVAIEWQADRFQAESDLACAVDIDIDAVKLDAKAEIELFRVFQQALANIKLHPGAIAVEVKLRRDGSDLLLEIRDDGEPPNPKDAMEHELGILTMKERTERAGGTFSISGSIVRFRLPLRA